MHGQNTAAGAGVVDQAASNRGCDSGSGVRLPCKGWSPPFLLSRRPVLAVRSRGREFPGCSSRPSNGCPHEAAVQSGPGAVKFGHAGDIEHVLQAQQVFDPRARMASLAAFGSEDHFFQSDLILRLRRSISSAISSPMEAVQHMTVDCRSTRNWHCMSTLPGPTGMAMAPNFSQPS